MTNRPIGSLWGKWDLHFHTPSSYDYGNGAITDELIVEGLKFSGIVAVAVTDHHKIDVDRIVRLQRIAGPDLTIFPGIELRSELGGKESVHLIGIFSERQDPAFIWNKLQGPLGLTSQEVSSKGDDRVYVKFEQAADLIHGLNGIVSVHAGRKSNSLENIGNKFPYKQEFKTDLVKSHIDLFEIGRLEDANDYHGIVFPSIGLEKPIVICSDNHDITNYKLKSPCWVKADPVFEAFQQILSDPRDRVYLGELPPSMDRVNKNPTKYFKSISFRKLPSSSLNEDWFSGSVPLNPGLIAAIIGNKGMGKTALAESIGLLGNTAQHRAFSFLNTSKFKLPKGNKAILVQMGEKVTPPRNGPPCPAWGVCVRHGLSLFTPEMVQSQVFPHANPNSRPAIPQHPNDLQVIIDIRYQCAIMVSLSWHGLCVPCEPCAPATRSF